MATTTITGLTAVQAGNLDDTAVLAVDDANTNTRKATIAQLRTALNAGSGGLSSTTDVTLNADSDGNASGAVLLQINGSTKARLTNGGSLFVGDDANANMTVGLTINQGAADDELIAGKSSDVATGMTSRAETDTFLVIKKNDGAAGGVHIEGLSEGVIAFRALGAATTATSTHSTAAGAPVFITGGVKSGTDIGSAGGNNVLAIGSTDGAHAIFDGAGNIYLNAVANDNAFDEHDDDGLLSTLRAEMMPDKQAAERFFGQFVGHAENRATLIRGGVIEVTARADGGEDVFFSLKGVLALTIDGVRQVAGRTLVLEGRVENMEARLALLERRYLNA